MQFDPEKSPTYLFRHPFRFVKPYEHAYETHAKKRWLGKPLIQTLAKQFQAYSQQYFNEAIKSGKVTINGKIVVPAYVIKNSDLLRHQTVREQPPVLDLPIEIIFEDEDFLVVNKPPSMVVHTGGGYHFNTLMAILYYEMGYKNLYILHRLDRLTSGLVILAKKKQKTTKFHEQSMEEVMKKSYYARVSGNVDFTEKIVDAPLICLSHREGIWGVYDPKINDPPHQQKPKQSCTKFVKVWYDDRTDSTLLQCYPITGRTHQIRVHLQYIGHSILNDTCYGGKFVGNWIVQMIKDIKSSVENDKEIVDVIVKKLPPNNIKGMINNKQQSDELQKKEINAHQLSEEWLNKWDYSNRPMEIFLHSYRYKFQGKQYTSRKPYWVDSHLNFQLKQLHQNQNKEQKLRSNYQEQFLRKKRQQKAINNLNKEQKQQQKQQEIHGQQQSQKKQKQIS